MRNTFEDLVSDLNKDHFLQEFTFEQTTFTPAAGSEVELADSLVLLEDMLIVYQLKERGETSGQQASDTEKNWFRRKVISQATKQIRDTLRYLEENSQIEMQNFRGHAIEVKSETLKTIHKVVSFVPHPLLPDEQRRHKYHQSKTAGVIHIFTAIDYVGVVRTLLTPSEISNYLSFRETMIETWGEKVRLVEEIALVGQFVAGAYSACPDNNYASFVFRLAQDIEEWDISGVLRAFPDRIIGFLGGYTDYYQIVKEIAKLRRDELKEFKKRFVLMMEASKGNDYVSPYRIGFTRTDCGFVFLPITPRLLSKRRNALRNTAIAHKYEQQLKKCIGVSMSPDEEDGWNNCEWIYLEYDWEYQQEIEDFLADEGNPLRSVRTIPSPGYQFEDGKEK